MISLLFKKIYIFIFFVGFGSLRQEISFGEKHFSVNRDFICVLQQISLGSTKRPTIVYYLHCMEKFAWTLLYENVCTWCWIHGSHEALSSNQTWSDFWKSCLKCGKSLGKAISCFNSNAIYKIRSTVGCVSCVLLFCLVTRRATYYYHSLLLLLSEIPLVMTLGILSS